MHVRLEDACARLDQIKSTHACTYPTARSLKMYLAGAFTRIFNTDKTLLVNAFQRKISQM
jgi:hypothetical protein